LRNAAGSAPGSIIAAIIETHAAKKKENAPRVVPAPMSIPFMRRSAMTQQIPAVPSVTRTADASTSDPVRR
jgi:hypothetical protein